METRGELSSLGEGSLTWTELYESMLKRPGMDAGSWRAAGRVEGTQKELSQLWETVQALAQHKAIPQHQGFMRLLSPEAQTIGHQSCKQLQFLCWAAP